MQVKGGFVAKHRIALIAVWLGALTALCFARTRFPQKISGTPTTSP
jgi:uncharacterized membrane protein YdfJ with MMPL/SSD domain